MLKEDKPAKKKKGNKKLTDDEVYLTQDETEESIPAEEEVSEASDIQVQEEVCEASDVPAKEEVSDTLALIEYYKYIAEYKPAERYAFGEPAVKVEKELKFDNENTVADNLLVILFNPISYADVRNRSFAA